MSNILVKSRLSTTRNSSLDEIGERYHLNYVIVVKLYHPYTQFPRNIRLSRRRIATFIRRILTFFLLLRLINTLTYLLTDQFLVDNYLWL